jgi:hypothetical protein
MRPVTAATPSIGGIAPAAPPLTIFCCELRLSERLLS